MSLATLHKIAVLLLVFCLLCLVGCLQSKRIEIHPNTYGLKGIYKAKAIELAKLGQQHLDSSGLYGRYYYNFANFIMSNQRESERNLRNLQERDELRNEMASLKHELKLQSKLYLSGQARNSESTLHSDVLISAKLQDVQKSVVTIQNNEITGSGFFIDDAGLIVTSSDIVNNSQLVTAIPYTDEKVNAVVIKSDPKLNIALLRANFKSLYWLRGVQPYQVSIGDKVIAIGAVQGFTWSLEKGIISGIENTELGTYYQTDADINPENSGGPLIHMKTGKVVAVNMLTLEEDIKASVSLSPSYNDVLKLKSKYVINY